MRRAPKGFNAGDDDDAPGLFEPTEASELAAASEPGAYERTEATENEQAGAALVDVERDDS